MTTTTLTGHAAISYASTHGLTLSKHADPTEGARDGLTPDEAREIAREDPRLVYVAVEVSDAQIESLQTAAGQAGDILQAAICARALGADLSDYPLSQDEAHRVELMTIEAARAECARVIR